MCSPCAFEWCLLLLLLGFFLLCFGCLFLEVVHHTTHSLPPELCTLQEMRVCEEMQYPTQNDSIRYLPRKNRTQKYLQKLSAEESSRTIAIPKAYLIKTLIPREELDNYYKTAALNALFSLLHFPGKAHKIAEMTAGDRKDRILCSHYTRCSL